LWWSQKIAIEYAKINGLLELELPQSEIDTILKSLGFAVADGVATIPTWRHDIAIWQDLAEEVGRIYGYNKVPLIPMSTALVAEKSEYYLQEFIKDVLADAGLVEVINYTFLSEEDVTAAGLNASDLLEIANPVQPENKYLRNSIIPGLIKTVAKNPIFDPVLVFEIGQVFTKDTEAKKIALATSGKGAKEMIEKAVSSLETALGVEAGKINYREINRDELGRFKVRKPSVFVVEIDFALILKDARIDRSKIELKLNSRTVSYRPISRFPSIARDLAFIVDAELNADFIADVIYTVSPLINRVELFDEFASDKFGRGMKNVAYHINLQHPERTLTDSEAEEIIKTIIKNIEQKFEAKLRIN
jgi:phenylalanyl-tRNA synthetase beta chain